MRARSSQRQCGAERREQRWAGGGVCEVSSQGTSSILGVVRSKGVQLEVCSRVAVRLRVRECDREM